MKINKVKIKNFKCYKDFSLDLNEGLNILVGDNEAGKSTILEAINLALTGLLNGKYLKTELTQYLFNKEIVDKYIIEINSKVIGVFLPPEIIIEIFIDDFPLFEGNNNSLKKKECGFSFSIKYDEIYNSEYQTLIDSGDIKTLPIEYYDFKWETFAREYITPKFIPLKSALIDSTNTKFKNGSDIYISHIVRDFLGEKEITSISQAHRGMKDNFIGDKSIDDINTKLNSAINISSKNISLEVDLSSNNAWENSLITCLDDIPFHHIGKGEQCIIKTKLALKHKKNTEANILLLEEPENHLSYSKMNQLIKDIENENNGKQIIISTHSSFVANKLGLNNLILLNKGITFKLDKLTLETQDFFKKLPGFEILRLVLSKKAILVEGDGDELVVQKAYKDKYNKLPIEDGIDIISVRGLSFLRFLEIAENLTNEVFVVTDNDGDIENKIEKKYSEYLGKNKKENIKICYDLDDTNSGTLTTGTKNPKKFNYNTLEPNLLKVNSLKMFNKIFGKSFTTQDQMFAYMYENKALCALKLFDTQEKISYPKYILDAIS
ncbi:MAG: AAA family ATPase [Candidatus Gracilibacteria bacterium]|nr:AAA family ATPase [Candidatus Gracilibacteria bacterium]